MRGGRVRKVVIPRMHAEERGAIALQRAFRGFKGRFLWHMTKRELAAAVKIQRCVRCRQARKMLERLRAERCAATTIQACARMYLVLYVFWIKRDKSALRIQLAHRQSKAHRAVQRRREDVNVRILQRTFVALDPEHVQH